MSTISDLDRMVADFMADDPLTVTYRKYTYDATDPNLDMSSVVPVDIPCSAIFLDISLRSAGDGTKAGTLIRDGDKLLFLRPPEKTDPLRLPLVINTVTDRILIGTTTYTIITYKSTNPSAANCILYELYLRN